ncbi:MAG: hypothetical protein HYU02_04300 [Thaumarchaeota archaeon]|nr:hypothetical protein [Nitrososphaerota archaeon]
MTAVTVKVEAQQDSSRFVKEFSLPKGSNPFAIASDSSGNVWISLRNFSSIAKLDPKTGKVEEFLIPSKSQVLQIWSMAFDAKGNLWFGDATENKIRKFDLARSKFYEFLIPTPDAQPWGIALDAKGDVWFAGFNSGKLGKLDNTIAKNGTSEGVTEFSTPTNASRPSNLLLDSSNSLWLMESGPAKLAKFDLPSSKFTEYSLPRTGNSSTNPIGIALDSEGKIWYTQFRTSNVGRFDPRASTVEQYATGLLTGATYGIASDREGNIWTIQQRVDRIVKIAPKEMTISEFRIPTNQSFTENITVDPSGNVWFVETVGHKVGMIAANTKLPIKMNLPSSKFTISPTGRLRVPITFESSEAGSFFPHLRASMAATGNVINASFVFLPDIIQMNSADKATSELTITANNFEPGNYKFVVGFTDRGLSFYQGQFFDLTVEKGGIEFLPALVIIAAILGAVIYFAIYRMRLGAVRNVPSTAPSRPLSKGG